MALEAAVARHDTTNTERQRRKRDKLEGRGLTQCNVWIPEAAKADIHLIAELLRAHPHLVAGPLRDPVSGKYVALRPDRPVK
jgi:hypothetical protein